MADSLPGRAKRFFSQVLRPARAPDPAPGSRDAPAGEISRRRTGDKGEETAARYLMSKGWRIVCRNWRPKGAYHGLELDIVAHDGDTLAFVEVKTRSFSKNGRQEKRNKALCRTTAEETRHTQQCSSLPEAPRPEAASASDACCGADIPAYAAFTPRKKQNMFRAARRYLAATESWNHPCRFDLVCVQQEADGAFRIDHYENVIEAGQAVDSGNASWEPW